MGQTSISASIGKDSAISVKFSGAVSTLVFKPFRFVATEGQTIFTLPSTPKQNNFFIVNLNGTPLDKEGGDFTIVGNTLTLDEGADVGDILYGIYTE